LEIVCRPIRRRILTVLDNPVSGLRREDHRRRKNEPGPEQLLGVRQMPQSGESAATRPMMVSGFWHEKMPHLEPIPRLMNLQQLQCQLHIRHYSRLERFSLIEKYFCFQNALGYW
jgi:hypothetical protein